MDSWKFKVKIFFVFLMFLAFLPVAFSVEALGPSCDNNENYGVKEQVLCGQETELLSKISVYSQNSQDVLDSVKESTQTYDVKSNNTLSDIQNNVLFIASGLILFVFTYSGLMWIVSSTSPKQREKAKKYLTASFYMILFVVAASYLTDLAHDLSNGSVVALSSSSDTFFDASPWYDIANKDYGGSDHISNFQVRYNKLESISPVFIFIGWIYLILMYLRNMLIVLFTVLAPLIIIMFFYPPTRSYGKFILALYLIELLIPIVFYPVFAIAAGMFSGVSETTQITIMAAALAVASILHVLLLVVGVMKASSYSGGED